MEFEAPIGYKEPKVAKQAEIGHEEPPQDHVMEEVVETFKGSGVRLDGKKKKDSQLDTPVVKKVSSFRYIIGTTIDFFVHVRVLSSVLITYLDYMVLYPKTVFPALYLI